jgi:hypothetical protein
MRITSTDAFGLMKQVTGSACIGASMGCLDYLLSKSLFKKSYSILPNPSMTLMSHIFYGSIHKGLEKLVNIIEKIAINFLINKTDFNEIKYSNQRPSY